MIDYRQTLEITTYIPFAESVTTLKYGTNLIGGQLLHMKQLHIYPSFTMSQMYPYCMSINMKFTDDFFVKAVELHALRDEYFWTHWFRISLSGHSHKAVLNQAILFLTSEKNSFGPVINHWYVGNVEPFRLQQDKFHFLRVTHMRIYEYLHDTCSKQSFFECVASKLTKSKMCNDTEIACAPYSLPGKSLTEDYQMCPKEVQLECYQRVSRIIWPECRELRSCVVNEYSLIDDGTVYLPYIDVSDYQSHGFKTKALQELLSGTNNSYIFTLYYDNPDWQKGDRSIKLRVDVHQEYLVWTLNSLIGNVGGVLGLTVGFSFMGYIEALILVFKRVGKKILRIH